MLTNTQILCYVLGWQGGTIHQVAEKIKVSTDEILKANGEQLHALCRKAVAESIDNHILLEEVYAALTIAESNQGLTPEEEKRQILENLAYLLPKIKLARHSLA